VDIEAVQNLQGRADLIDAALPIQVPQSVSSPCAKRWKALKVEIRAILPGVRNCRIAPGEPSSEEYCVWTGAIFREADFSAQILSWDRNHPAGIGSEQVKPGDEVSLRMELRHSGRWPNRRGPGAHPPKGSCFTHPLSWPRPSGQRTRPRPTSE
jgi:hypothetical protein